MSNETKASGIEMLHFIFVVTLVGVLCIYGAVSFVLDAIGWISALWQWIA